MELTRDKAWELLTCYNKEAFHLRHALTVEAVMGWFAQQLGYGDEKAFWSMVGLLHDLDFEQWPEEHCVKCQQLMRDEGIDERLIRCRGQPRLGHLCGYSAGARDGKGAFCCG